MNIKKTLLVAAMAAFAFSAMPTVASALITGAHVKFGAAEKRKFTVDQDETVQPRLITPESEIKCKELGGSGEFEKGGTTGTIELTFTTCKIFNLFTCTTAGLTGGTITTTTLPFHVEPVNQTPGVLITPKEGHFMTFTCANITCKVEGNGVIGTITKPGWTTKSKEATVKFSQTGGLQDHLTTDTSTEKFDLILNCAGTKETAALEGAGIFTFEEEVELEDTDSI